MALTIETVRLFTPEADFGAIINFLTKYQTRQDLADRLQVSRWTLYSWESGKFIPSKESRTMLLDAVELRVARIPEQEVPDSIRALLQGAEA